MSSSEELVPGVSYNDRKIALILFGIFQLILGCILTLFLLLTIISSKIASSNMTGQPGSSPDMRDTFHTILFFLPLVVWFVCLGIGSIKARRWARALSLVTSWIWILIGLCVTSYMVFLMPDIGENIVAGEQISPEIVSKIKSFTLIFMLIFFLIIPGFFILFYRNKNVKATCEQRDTTTRWTDKCPLPILAISISFALWLGTHVSCGFDGWKIPFFGAVLTGFLGTLIGILGILFLGYIVIGTYKLDIRAWWCALLMIIAPPISWGITLAQMTTEEYFMKMGFQAQELDMLKYYNLTDFNSNLFYVFLTCCSIAYLGYTKRYFDDQYKSKINQGATD